MTTTRSRSLTITTQGTEIRAHIDQDGVVSVSNLPIGRIVESAHGWKPASLSGIAGQEFPRQIDAIETVVKLHHLRALAATA